MGSGQQRGLIENVAAPTCLPDGLQTTPENAQGAAGHARARQSQLFEQVCAQAAHGIWALDLEGFTVFANPAMEEMLGLSSGQLLGRDAMDFVASEARQSVAQRLTRSRLGQRQRESLEIPLVHRDGHAVWVQLGLGPLSDERELPAGSLLFVSDISELKRGEHERERVQARTIETQKHASLGILAGGIAHDFNNLLAVIIGQIEIVSADEPLDPKSHLALGSAISAAQRAAGLTRQLLDYAGRSHLHESAIPLRRQTRELLDKLSFGATSQVQIELALGTQDWQVLGDPERIQQSTAQLLHNAVEAYGDSPGRVFVSVGCQLLRGEIADAHPPGPVKAGEYVFIEVRDEGAGMSSATLARAFEPFFTTKSSGRGLGLAACMGVVRAHGGFLTARSELGVGSTFRVYLPRAQAPESSLSPESTKVTPLAKRPLKVLVVDDEPMIRAFARSMLEAEGYAVEDAASGTEALEILRARTAEIGGVLLDLSMPGMDGSVVLSSLRTFAPDLPVVIQTGYSAEATAQRLAQWRVLGVLQKPYRASQLLDSISAMFSLRA